MLRTITSLSLLALAACDQAPPMPPHEPSLQELKEKYAPCLVKRKLDADLFLILVTTQTADATCRLDEKRMLDRAAALAEYVEVPGSDCHQSREALMKPVIGRVRATYKEDGPNKFCAWVSQMLDRKSSELWTRFWD